MSKSQNTKEASVKRHLENGHTITPLEAFNMYGTMRLSAIIFNLRQSGLNIITLDDNNSYATYQLIKDEEVA